MMQSAWWLFQLVLLVITIVTHRSDAALPSSSQQSKQLPRAEQQCGKVHRLLYKRVVGGHDSDAHSHPWTVYIFVEHNLSLTKCGGALIDKQWVLSTAQCFITGWTVGDYTYNIQDVTTSFGKHNLTAYEEGQQDMVVPLQNIYKHRLFNQETLDYNIALIKLPKPVEFGDTVQPICMPASNLKLTDYVDEWVTFNGWGLVENGKRTEVLQEATTYVISTDSCKEKFSDTNFTINDRTICLEGSLGTMCTGDSGSPIEYQNDEGTNILLGINSFAKVEPDGICPLDLATGGSYIPSYIDWINEVTGMTLP